MRRTVAGRLENCYVLLCLLIAPEMAPVCTIICIFVGIGIGALCSAGCNWAADQLTGCQPMEYKDLWPAVKEI